MTVIDGTSTTTPTFSVGQRVKYVTDHNPAGRDNGEIYAYSDASGEQCVEILSEGVVTATRGTSVRVKFDDGTETRLVAGWRFAPVETSSEQPLAEWERELLELPAPVEAAETAPEPETPTVETTPVPELAVGMRVRIDPRAGSGENRQGAAWENEDPFPSVGVIVDMEDDDDEDPEVRAEDYPGYSGIADTQFVNREFLTPIVEETTTALKAVDKPWRPKLNEVVLVDEEAFRKEYGEWEAPKYAQVIKLYSTSADLLYLEMANGADRVRERSMAHLDILRPVPEGADAPKPIVPKKAIMRLKSDPTHLVRVMELFVDGWVLYVDLTDKEERLRDTRLDYLEPLPPLPMEPGQLKADDIKPGREYRLHPDAMSCQPGGNRAFRGLKKLPERVLASERWYDDTDHERGLIVCDLRGESSWVETKWLVPLNYDDENALGGDELFGRKGEVFVYDPAPTESRRFGYYTSDKQPTRVVLEEDFRSPANGGRWYVSALDGSSPGYGATVLPGSLKELTERSPEHAYELRRLEDKVTEAKREVEKAKEAFEDLLTEMFAIMDVRATKNGLCTVWEEERDGAIARFFEEKGFAPGVMPRTTGGDVYQRQGVSCELLFVTDPAGGSCRSRQLIDRKGKEYPLTRFAKEARQGLWVRIIGDGQITKD